MIWFAPSLNAAKTSILAKRSDDLEHADTTVSERLNKGVAGIIEAGQVLIEAKNKLPHGQFTDWVDRELRFGARRRTAVVKRIYARHKC